MYSSFVNSDDLIDILAPGSYSPEILEAVRATKGCPPLGPMLARVPKLGITGTIENAYVSEKHPEAVPYITTKQIDGPTVYPIDCKFIRKQADEVWAKCRVTEGDILICKSGKVGSAGLLRTLGYSHCNSVSDVINIRLREDSELDPYYLVLFLNSRWGQAQLQQQSGGAIFDHVSIYAIPEIRVKVYELNILRAIGNKVRKAERLLDLAEAALTAAQTTLNDALCWKSESRKDRSNVNWTSVEDLRTVRLDAKYYQPVFVGARHRINEIGGTSSLVDLAVSICNGVEIRDFVSDGQPYLVVGNIDSGDLQIDNAPRISVNSEVPAKAQIEEGDLLVVRSASIGQAAEILEEDVASGAVISADFIKLRLVDPLRSGFISAFLNSEIGKLFQEQIAIGAVQLHIGQEELGDLPIPNLGEEAEQRIGKGYASWRRFRRQSKILIEAAKADVEALISNTIDFDALQTESAAIESWLAANPSPATKKN